MALIPQRAGFFSIVVVRAGEVVTAETALAFCSTSEGEYIALFQTPTEAMSWALQVCDEKATARVGVDTGAVLQVDALEASNFLGSPVDWSQALARVASPGQLLISKEINMEFLLRLKHWNTIQEELLLLHY